MRNEFGEKKFGHVNLKHISKLSKKNLVKGMPNICWKTHLLCEACQQGKHIKISLYESLLQTIVLWNCMKNLPISPLRE